MPASPLAALIVKARRARASLPLDPALTPPSLHAALAVQAEVASELGETAAGWKVGFTPEGAAWAAPIFAGDMRAGEYRLAAGETVKVEGELGVRFSRDLLVRPGQPYTREEVLDAIGEVFAGIELVASRFADSANTAFLARIGDSFSNLAYMIGGGTKDFRALDLSKLPCRIAFDGATKHEAVGGHANADPLIPLVAWASEQIDYLGGMRAGQFLTTGTLNTPIPASQPTSIHLTIGGVGEAKLALVR
ncbi:MAG: fumarylacetoacetate hydrolase family protein [Beijerinckiaceae bacterium]